MWLARTHMHMCSIAIIILQINFRSMNPTANIVNISCPQQFPILWYSTSICKITSEASEWSWSIRSYWTLKLTNYLSMYYATKYAIKHLSIDPSICIEPLSYKHSESEYFPKFIGSKFQCYGCCHHNTEFLYSLYQDLDIVYWR